MNRRDFLNKIKRACGLAAVGGAAATVSFHPGVAFRDRLCEHVSFDDDSVELIVRLSFTESLVRDSRESVKTLSNMAARTVENAISERYCNGV